MKLIDVSTRKFPNVFTMVDDADFEWLNQWKWCPLGTGHPYAVRGVIENGKKRMILMHREIMNPPLGMVVDHRSGNALDNRRENLRICTQAQNTRNKKPNPGRALPKGVSWYARKRKFQSQIVLDNQSIHLGYFHTPAEAEAAYIEGSKKYHGEFSFTERKT